jgi:hypothetical protein
VAIDNRILRCLSWLALPLILAARLAESGTTPANPGYTGLWEYPTAEIPGDGEGRVGYSHASPYAFYYANLAWLPWVEINSRLTTFDNVFVSPRNEISGTPNGRDYMDKAMDIKVMLHRSRKWYLPSAAFGVTDIMGTELMKAWYGVATWRLGRSAFSAGYGTDRLNGFFGGFSWDVADWLTLKFEYSPLDYASDAAGRVKVHPDAADSKFNFGAVLIAPWGTEASLSWQRGEEFVVALSQNFDMGGVFFGGKGGRNYESPGTPRVALWKDVDTDRLGSDNIEALER